MHRITFGRRARRRSRLRRLGLRAWLVTLVGTALGVPAPTGMDLLARLQSPPPSRGIEASEAVAATTRFRRAAFDARPVQRPRLPEREPERSSAGGSSEEGQPPAAQAATVPQIVAAAAAEFGVDPGLLVSVARCESDLDPQAQSPHGYHGLFQFDVETWAAYGYGSIYDPVAQSRTAARLMAAGEADRWPNCA